MYFFEAGSSLELLLFSEEMLFQYHIFLVTFISLTVTFPEQLVLPILLDFFVIDRVFFWVISDMVFFRVLNEKVLVRIVSSRVPFWSLSIRSSLGSSVIMSSLRLSGVGSYLQSTVIRSSTNSLGFSLVPSFLFFGMSV